MTRTLAWCFVWLAVLSPSPHTAEASTDVTGFPAVWLEVTPQSRDADPSVHTAAEAPLEADDLMPGLSMVCWGGQEAAVSCERQVVEERAVIRRSPLPGLSVTGTVFIGRFPAEEARISVVPHGLAFRRQFTVPLAWNSEIRELRRQVSTDAKGRFLVPPLAAGDWFLEVHLPGGRLERSEPFTLPERSADEEEEASPVPFDLGVLSFDVGTRLEVYVTDSAGLPVPHAQVGGAQGAQPLESDFFEVRADENGLAVVTGLEPDETLSIACTAAGYTWVRQTYEAPPADASCTLEALATLRGTVVDVDDEPVAEATLALSALQKEASTDDDGSFVLRELKPGTYALSVAAPGLSSRSVDLELTPGDDLDLGALELAPGRSLRVRVLDAETGEPVPGARVEILEPRGGGGGVSDPDGEVRLKTGSTETLLLETRAGGYAAARDEVSPEILDGSEAVPLELSRAGYLEVQAWHPDGSPCSGCTVWVMSRETETVSLQVDATGHVRSGELPPGDYQAILARERSLGRVVQVSGGDNVRRAAIEPRRTTTVRFGEAKAALHVVLDPPLPPGWRLQAQGPGWDRLYEAGADVELPREPGEPVRLAAGGPGGTTIELGTIPAFYDRDVYHLEVPNGSAGGVLVRDEPSAERRPLTLTLRDATTGLLRATMRSISTGAFRIPFLRPGAYTLHAGDTPLTTFSVAPGRREDLGELTLQ